MALDEAQCTEELIAALEAAGRYVDENGDPLEGEAKDLAHEQTRAGAVILIGVIFEHVRNNAEVATTVSTTVSGTAATDGITFENFPITETADGEVLQDASVSGTGSGTGAGSVS